MTFIDCFAHFWRHPFNPGEEEKRLALELAEVAQEHEREIERAKEIRARLQILDTQVRSFSAAASIRRESN